MARVITARRDDTCRDPKCQSPAIKAGEEINYGGYGAVSHAACKPLESAARSGRPGRCTTAVCLRALHPEDYPCCGCER